MFTLLYSPDLHAMQTTNNLASLLIAPINSYQSVLTLLALPRYLPRTWTLATRFPGFGAGGCASWLVGTLRVHVYYSLLSSFPLILALALC